MLWRKQSHFNNFPESSKEIYKWEKRYVKYFASLLNFSCKILKEDSLKLWNSKVSNLQKVSMTVTNSHL